MNLSIGEYIILEHTYWSIERATILRILDICKYQKTVHYDYGDVDDTERVRSILDFDYMKLVPSSSLTKELI
jgi:hypothetical protein